MTPTAAERLADALRQEDPYKFLDQLAIVDPRYNGISFHERREPLATFGLVYALYADVHYEGIWKFLVQGEGAGFYQTVDVCRRLGAVGTVEYLTRVAALFPDGRVPEDDRRDAVVFQLEEEASDAGTAEPLGALDKEFADAMPELVAALRAWVERDRARITAVLAALPGPEAPAPPLVAMLESALDVATREVEDVLRDRDERWNMIRAGAEASGLLPWSDRGTDPRYLQFLAAVERFGLDEWRQVALRVLAAPRQVDDLLSVSFNLQRVIDDSGGVDEDAFSAAHTRYMDARDAVFSALEALPAQERYKGRSIGLSKKARAGFVGTTVMMWLHDWAIFLPDTREALRFAYGLFDGLASCPEVPAS